MTNTQLAAAAAAAANEERSQQGAAAPDAVWMYRDNYRVDQGPLTKAEIGKLYSELRISDATFVFKRGAETRTLILACDLSLGVHMLGFFLLSRNL